MYHSLIQIWSNFHFWKRPSVKVERLVNFNWPLFWVNRRIRGLLFLLLLFLYRYHENELLSYDRGILRFFESPSLQPRFFGLWWNSFCFKNYHLLSLINYPKVSNIPFVTNLRGGGVLCGHPVHTRRVLISVSESKIKHASLRSSHEEKCPQFVVCCQS